VGKGGPWLFPYLLSRYGLAPEETCIIGDRLDTDIAMGQEGGLVTLLPLTGTLPWTEGRRGLACAASVWCD
jgi:ribonucleotide monophosphatase NagD (HAD superfamily)